jgi:hypothetical protein
MRILGVLYRYIKTLTLELWITLRHPTFNLRSFRQEPGNEQKRTRYIWEGK